MTPDYAVWRPLFEKVIDPRLYTLEWIDRQVREERWKLLTSGKAACLIELRFYPTGACRVAGVVAAGDLEEIRTVLIPQAFEMGRAVPGCIGGLIESRDGWGRVLKQDGWQPYQTTLVKDF